ATLQLLASAEKGSEHPLAEAIVASATEKDVPFRDVDDFEAIPGHGIRAVIANKEMFIGTRKLMTDNGIDIQDAEDRLSGYETDGKTAMLIAVNGEYCGIVAVADTVKES